jgi:hypothetical protein
MELETLDFAEASTLGFTPGVWPLGFVHNNKYWVQERPTFDGEGELTGYIYRGPEVCHRTGRSEYFMVFND